MWKKIFCLGMVMLLGIMSVLAIEECQRNQEPRNIPCMIYSSWKPADCTIYNITVINSTEEYVLNMTWQNLITRCNATWNITKEGTYLWNSSIDSGVIVVEAKDNMMSFSIVLFLILFNITIFALPSMVQFSSVKMWHKMIAKIIYVAGLGILAFNLSIMIKMADDYGIVVVDELLLYQGYMSWVLYISMIYLFWNTMVTTIKEYKIEKKKRTMGEE